MAAERSLALGRVKAVPVDGMHWVRGIYDIQPTRPIEARIMREFAAFVESWNG